MGLLRLSHYQVILTTPGASVNYAQRLSTSSFIEKSVSQIKNAYTVGFDRRWIHGSLSTTRHKTHKPRQLVQTLTYIFFRKGDTVKNAALSIHSALRATVELINKTSGVLYKRATRRFVVWRYFSGIYVPYSSE